MKVLARLGVVNIKEVRSIATKSFYFLGMTKGSKMKSIRVGDKSFVHFWGCNFNSVERALIVPSSNAYAIPVGNPKSGDNGMFSLFFALFGALTKTGKGQTNDITQTQQDIKQRQERD